MMFLMKRKREDMIINNLDLACYLNDGWKIVKPLPNLPMGVKRTSVGVRSTKKIVEWYKSKISMYDYMANQYRDDLKKFRKMIR